MTPRSGMLDVVRRVLYPVMLLGSVWLLLRGHNAPGGGFIGGLVAVAATAALAVADGTASARRRMLLEPLRLAAAGVLLALLSGLPALLTGAPFLTHLWIDVPLGAGSLALSTVYVFDFGVWATVWGALGGLCLQVIGLDERTGVAVSGADAGATPGEPERREPRA